MISVKGIMTPQLILWAVMHIFGRSHFNLSRESNKDILYTEVSIKRFLKRNLAIHVWMAQCMNALTDKVQK